eukprot:2806668-Amphidinium_carterae.2
MIARLSVPTELNYGRHSSIELGFVSHFHFTSLRFVLGLPLPPWQVEHEWRLKKNTFAFEGGSHQGVTLSNQGPRFQQWVRQRTDCWHLEGDEGRAVQACKVCGVWFAKALLQRANRFPG